MSKTKHTFKLTALVTALALAYGLAHGPAFAESLQDDIARFTIPESSVTIGIGHQSGEREQFGIFDGVMDSETVLLFDANIVKRDAETGTWKTLSISDLGLDSREIKAGIERQGSWGAEIGYNRIVRDAPYTINTEWAGVGTTELIRPAASGTPGSGTTYRMGTERDILSLEGFKYFSPKLSLKVEFKNEEKDGLRHWGRGNPSNEFAVEPIDYTTRQLEATLNYTGDKFQLSGGYYGSWFNNAHDIVCSMATAANVACTGLGASGTDPFAAGTSNPSFLSMPLDNQAHQIHASGAYSFTSATKGTFKVAYTHATMNETLPHSQIAGLSWVGAPSKLDGEINTTLVQLGLTSRPLPKLSLNANLRYYDMQDDTPIVRIIQTGAPGTTASNTPLSYKTISGKVEGTYSLMHGYSVVAGIDYSDQDRTVPVGRLDAGVDQERFVPFRADLDEATYRVQLRKSLSETLNGGIALLHSDRDGSAYAEAVHSEPGEGIHPESIDPVNISDRKRDKVRLSMDWMPREALSIQLNYENARDDYSGHTYGLRDGKAALFSADTSYAINKDWQVNAWYSYDSTKANLLGWRQGSNGGTGNAELDKDTDLKDTGNAVGIGLTGQLNPKVKMGADLQWSRTKSEINQALTALTISPITGLPVTTTGTNLYAANTAAEQLPDITSTSTRIKLFVEYALKKNADLRVDLIHERWKTDDWTWQFSDGTAYIYGGTTTDGTMVITDPKQNATFVAVSYKFKF